MQQGASEREKGPGNEKGIQAKKTNAKLIEPFYFGRYSWQWEICINASNQIDAKECLRKHP